MIDTVDEIAILFENIYEIYGDIRGASNSFQVKAYEQGNTSRMYWYNDYEHALLHFHSICILKSHHHYSTCARCGGFVTSAADLRPEPLAIVLMLCS